MLCQSAQFREPESTELRGCDIMCQCEFLCMIRAFADMYCRGHQVCDVRAAMTKFVACDLESMLHCRVVRALYHPVPVRYQLAKLLPVEAANVCDGCVVHLL